jgi:hypothetical protein
VRLCALYTAANTGLLNQSQMINDGDCGAISGLKIFRGNRDTRRKPTVEPLCPPQITQDQTRDRTRSSAVRRHPLIAWYTSMMRPKVTFRSSSSLNADVFLWRDILQTNIFWSVEWSNARRCWILILGFDRGVKFENFFLQQINSKSWIFETLIIIQVLKKFCLFWNWLVHYCIHKSSQACHSFSQTNIVHTLI